MHESDPQPSIAYTLDLFADYYQIWLQDEQVNFDPPADWGEQLCTQMIATAPGIVGIGTARPMTVPITMQFVEKRPELDLAAWDHVAEASLEVQSEQIVLAGCTDFLPEARHFAITPGYYRVRVAASGLNSISTDGLDGNDHYYVTLWPEHYQPITVLK